MVISALCFEVDEASCVEVVSVNNFIFAISPPKMVAGSLQANMPHLPCKKAIIMSKGLILVQFLEIYEDWFSLACGTLGPAGKIHLLQSSTKFTHFRMQN